MVTGSKHVSMDFVVNVLFLSAEFVTDWFVMVNMADHVDFPVTPVSNAWSCFGDSFVTIPKVC